MSLRQEVMRSGSSESTLTFDPSALKQDDDDDGDSAVFPW